MNCFLQLCFISPFSQEMISISGFLHCAEVQRNSCQNKGDLNSDGWSNRQASRGEKLAPVAFKWGPWNTCQKPCWFPKGLRGSNTLSTILWKRQLQCTTVFFLQLIDNSSPTLIFWTLFLQDQSKAEEGKILENITNLVSGLMRRQRELVNSHYFIVIELQSVISNEETQTIGALFLLVYSVNCVP